MTLSIGRELRLARINAGKTQEQVAQQLGCAKSEVSRREHGLIPSLGVVALARHAFAVGLQPSIKFFPAVRRPLDHAQLALLRRFRDRISNSWSFQIEVPMPITGDLRAVDALIGSPSVRIVVEAITRLADVQAQVRAAQLKRRDLKADRLLLLISGTTTNRASIRAAGATLRDAFPITTRGAIAALSEDNDPGGDCLVLM
jgi:transcriptional regulator with XRE-family HTH domain